MLIQIDGHVISTEAIVAITRMSDLDPRIFITMFGPSSIKIERCNNISWPEDIPWDLRVVEQLSAPAKAVYEAKKKAYYEELKKLHENDLRQINLMYSRLLEAWQPGSSKILVIDDKNETE